MAISFDNADQRISKFNLLTQTGSPVFFTPNTGGSGIIAQEDGSRLTALSPFVSNTADTSLTVAFIAKVLPNSGIGYLLHGGGGGFNNFECYVQANGTINYSIVGSGGADTHITTNAFDDSVERLYLFHFENDAVQLQTGQFKSSGSMALEADSQTANTYDSWGGLADVTINASPSGTFPLELNSTINEILVWNNQSAPTLGEADTLLGDYLALTNVGATVHSVWDQPGHNKIGRIN